MKTLLAGAALALATVPATGLAQEGAKFDCVNSGADAGLKASLGAAMTGAGDDANRDTLFKQLAAITDGCVAKHAITEEQKGPYFDYSLARISREWLVGDLAKLNLATGVVDKALAFGPGLANPDLSKEISNDHIMAIVQAYIDSGVDIEQVDAAVWEKVGAYAAATSIYWNKKQSLPF